MFAPPTTTLAALFALAVITGLIAATIPWMVTVWLRLPRGGRHRPAPRACRGPLAPTAVLPDGPFPAVDPDLTPRYTSLAHQPTAVLTVPSDPWAGQEDADALLTASRNR